MGQLVRVLWISSVGEKGGAEVYMLNFLRRLDRARFAPWVAMLRPGPLADDLKELEVPILEMAPHRMRNLIAVGRAIRALVRRAGEHRIDLIHSNGFRAHVYGGIAARRLRRPEIWSVHTVEKPSWTTRMILRIPTTRVAANCPRTADYFLAQGLPTGLIWPGVDEERLGARTPRKELAERYQLPCEARWICLGARLQRYKGHEYFIRALASLPDRHRDVQAVITGGALFGMERSFQNELLALARELRVDQRVRFTGFIPDADVYGFLAASELLVHPALDEDFGLIVAEAQALGTPVLAYAAVGPAAIIEPERTGRLVPVGAQAELNRGLAESLDDPERLRRWGEAARERALRHFSARRLTRQLERAYGSSLLQHGEIQRWRR